MDDHLSRATAVGGPVDARKDTMARIRRVFVKSLRLHVREQELPYAEMLEEAAILDSIAVLEFVTAVEREFGISLEPEYLKFDFLRDLSGLASYIDDRIETRDESQ
jgi:acyl carrier protein